MPLPIQESLCIVAPLYKIFWLSQRDSRQDPLMLVSKCLSTFSNADLVFLKMAFEQVTLVKFEVRRVAGARLLSNDFAICSQTGVYSSGGVSQYEPCLARNAVWQSLKSAKLTRLLMKLAQHAIMQCTTQYKHALVCFFNAQTSQLCFSLHSFSILINLPCKQVSPVSLVYCALLINIKTHWISKVNCYGVH